MAKKKAKQKSPGKCIFCGQGNMSGEHLWPEWAGPLVRGESPSKKSAEALYIMRGKSRIPIDAKVRNRQGDITHKKIRVVCESCNNGWMSGIETEAREIMVPMMRGEKLVLDSAKQSVLARWFALKMIVVENNRKLPDETEAITLPEDRKRFMLERSIPQYVKIWLALYLAFKSRNTFKRHAATMMLSPTPLESPPPSIDTRRKNIQTISFCVGQLFFYTIGSRAPNLDVGPIECGEGFYRLWPPTGRDIRWPPEFAIDDRGADGVSDSLARLMTNPKTIYIPDNAH